VEWDIDERKPDYGEFFFYGDADERGNRHPKHGGVQCEKDAVFGQCDPYGESGLVDDTIRDSLSVTDIRDRIREGQGR